MKQLSMLIGCLCGGMFIISAANKQWPNTILWSALAIANIVFL